MEKSRGQNPQEKGLNRALAEEKTWKKKKKCEDNIIKDVKNLFRLKNEIVPTKVEENKYKIRIKIRSLFRLNKVNYKNNRIIKNIIYFFEQEKKFPINQ